jgi:hypothetical protein
MGKFTVTDKSDYFYIFLDVLLPTFLNQWNRCPVTEHCDSGLQMFSLVLLIRGLIFIKSDGFIQRQGFRNLKTNYLGQ